MYVTAKTLKAGQVLQGNNRNRKIKAVFSSEYTDGPNGLYPSKTRIQKTYVVVPNTRGRGLEMIEFNSSQKVSVR